MMKDDAVVTSKASNVLAIAYKLGRIINANKLTTALTGGTILIDELYHGSIGRALSRNPYKDKSLSTISEHLKDKFLINKSPQRLSEWIRMAGVIHPLLKTNLTPTELERVTYMHYLYMVPLDTDEDILASAREDTGLVTRKLKERIEERQQNNGTTKSMPEHPISDYGKALRSVQSKANGGDATSANTECANSANTECVQGHNPKGADSAIPKGTQSVTTNRSYFDRVGPVNRQITEVALPYLENHSPHWRKTDAKRFAHDLYKSVFNLSASDVIVGLTDSDDIKNRISKCQEIFDNCIRLSVEIAICIDELKQRDATNSLAKKGKTDNLYYL